MGTVELEVEGQMFNKLNTIREDAGISWSEYGVTDRDMLRDYIVNGFPLGVYE